MIKIEKGVGRDYFIRIVNKITIFIGINSKECHDICKLKFIDSIKEVLSIQWFDSITIRLSRIFISIYKTEKARSGYALLSHHNGR